MAKQLARKKKKEDTVEISLIQYLDLPNVESVQGALEWAIANDFKVESIEDARTDFFSSFRVLMLHSSIVADMAARRKVYDSTARSHYNSLNKKRKPFGGKLNGR